MQHGEQQQQATAGEGGWTWLHNSEGRTAGAYSEGCLCKRPPSIFNFFLFPDSPTTHHHPLLSLFPSLSLYIKKMEDVYEGAIGIDLGTTYSWVLLR